MSEEHKQCSALQALCPSAAAGEFGKSESDSLDHVNSYRRRQKTPSCVILALLLFIRAHVRALLSRCNAFRITRRKFVSVSSSDARGKRVTPRP